MYLIIRSCIFAVAAATSLAMIASGCSSPEEPWKPTRPDGIVLPNEAFLKLPFKQHQAANLTVTQGWSTEATEASIIGGELHQAIDFEGYPYGAPILAAADGYAWYSYERAISATRYEDPLTGRKVEYIDQGAGLFVEIAHDVRADGLQGSPRWTSQYVHLERVADGIPYVESVESGSTQVGSQQIANYIPDGFKRPQEDLVAFGKRVKQGEIIGYHGDSGIGANWHDDWDPVANTIRPRDRSTLPPWDPQGAYEHVKPEWACQLHFSVFAGRGADGLQGRQNIIDPFDLYAFSDLGILPGHKSTNPYMRDGLPYAGPSNSKTAFVRQGGRLAFAD